MITESINTALLDGDNERLYELVLGETDPDTLEFSIEHYLANSLKARPTSLLFFELSISAVFGFTLSNDEKVVVKLFPEEIFSEHIKTVIKMQSYLFEKGFPCPKPLTDCERLCNAIAFVERLTEEGRFEDCLLPERVQELAREQVRLHSLLKEVKHDGLKEHIIPTERLWPLHLSEFYEFKENNNAEPIDKIALAAKHKVTRQRGALIVGHSDWSAKCTRFTGNRLTAAFDWYSLVAEDERILLGSTAASFWNTPYLDQQEPPTISLMEDYIRAYETAAGKEFSQDDRLIIRAAMAYRLALLARCYQSTRDEACSSSAFCQSLVKLGTELVD